MVRDRGVGIRPGVKAAEELSGGIGLPVIQALSESVEFRDLSTGGTEVAMHFDAAAVEPARARPPARRARCSRRSTTARPAI